MNEATPKLFCFSVKRDVFKLQMRVNYGEQPYRLRGWGEGSTSRAALRAVQGRSREPGELERSSPAISEGQEVDDGLTEAPLMLLSGINLSLIYDGMSGSAHGRKPGRFGQGCEALRGLSHGPCAQWSLRKNKVLLGAAPKITEGLPGSCLRL